MVSKNLTLEITNLQSERADSSWNNFSLPLSSGQTNEAPQVAITELDQISLSFRIEGEGLRSAMILADGVEMEGVIHPDYDGGDGFTTVYWRPERQRNSREYQSLFFNYFGIVQLIIQLDFHGKDGELYVLAPLEIQGRKVTADRAVAMLKYLSKNASGDILNDLCPTSKTSGVSKNGVQPADMLNRLESTVSKLETHFRRIVHAPIKKLQQSSETIYKPTPADVDSYGLDWLMENPWSMSEADRCEGLFEFDEQQLVASEVQTRLPVESTDIYENQLVHFCIGRIFQQAQKLVGRAKKQQSSAHHTLTVRENFVSFYEISNKHSGVSGGHLYLAKAQDVTKRLARLSHLATQYIPVSKQRVDRITVTEKIKAKRHYLEFVSSLHEWIEDKNILWGEAVSLSKVTSLPRLFEFYVTTAIHHVLEAEGTAITLNSGLFDGYVNGLHYRLRHEPTYWKPRHINCGQLSTEVVSVDQEKLHQSINDRNKPLVHRSRDKYLCREPDIVIERINPAGQMDALLVLDAKCWSSEKSVFKTALPELAMKYGLGLRTRDGQQIVKSVIAVNPAPENSDDAHAFNDFYAKPCNLYGAHPALPAIGSQRVEINPLGMEVGLAILIERLLTLLEPIDSTFSNVHSSPLISKENLEHVH